MTFVLLGLAGFTEHIFSLVSLVRSLVGKPGAPRAPIVHLLVVHCTRLAISCSPLCRGERLMPSRCVLVVLLQPPFILCLTPATPLTITAPGLDLLFQLPHATESIQYLSASALFHLTQRPLVHPFLLRCSNCPLFLWQSAIL